MIAEPPVKEGADQFKSTLPFSAVGRSEVGSPGIPGVAVTVFDASLVPALLTAMTLNE